MNAFGFASSSIASSVRSVANGRSGSAQNFRVQISGAGDVHWAAVFVVNRRVGIDAQLMEGRGQNVFGRDRGVDDVAASRNDPAHHITTSETAASVDL